MLFTTNAISVVVDFLEIIANPRGLATVQFPAALSTNRAAGLNDTSYVCVAAVS